MFILQKITFREDSDRRKYECIDSICGIYETEEKAKEARHKIFALLERRYNSKLSNETQEKYQIVEMILNDDPYC